MTTKKTKGNEPKRLALTKQQITKFHDIWDTKSNEEIAKELGLTKAQVSYVAARIRKAGFKLSQKRRTGYWDLLIKEALGGK